MTISQLIGFSTDSSIFHEMKNGEYPKNLEFSPFFSVPDVIRTRGLPLRSSLRNVVASGSIILTVAFNSGNTGKSLCSFWKLIN